MQRLLRFALPALCCFMILFATVVFASQGGRSGNGGGTGVACFHVAADAEQAKQLRLEHKPLPRKLLKKIWYLFTTEIAEHDISFFDYLEYYYIEPQNETYQAYLDRILSTYLGPISPSFEHKLQEIIHDHFDLNTPDTIKDVGALVPLDDTGPIKILSTVGQNCAVVQIVIRHAETQADGKIVSNISLDRDLFDLLGTNQMLGPNPKAKLINQAALILHEALYLLGYGLGQETSEQVRTLVTTLMSQQTFSRIGQLQMTMEVSGFIEQLKHHQFSQDPPKVQKNAAGALYISAQLYKMGFADFPTVDSTAPISPQASELHQAYLRVEQVLTTTDAPHPLIDPNFSDAESYIFVSNMALVTGKINDIYALLDPGVDSHQEFADVCSFAQDTLAHDKGIVTSDADAPISNAVLQKAIRYCGSKLN